jgi:hypothetical protein
MAEPLHTMWRKGCVIILAVLRSISSGLSSKNSSSIIILFKKVTPYCYSCHWKREELDRVQLEIAKSVNLRKDSHAATIIIEQPPSPSHQRPRQQTKSLMCVSERRSQYAAIVNATINFQYMVMIIIITVNVVML